MALPADYDTVPVRGRYVYLDGSPAQGEIRFTGKVIAISDATDTIVIPSTIVAPLAADGSFTAQLPATDDPDILPHGWTYRVEERLSNGGGRTYEIEVPLAALPSGIDLSEVAPLQPAHGDPTAFVTLAAFESHTHPGGPGGPTGWDDITDKPVAFPPEEHVHDQADITGLLAALEDKQPAGDYALDGHTHTQDEIAGLVAALASKLNLNRVLSADPGSTGYLRLNITYALDSHNSSDIEQVRVNNVTVSWRNEVGFWRGTPHPGYPDDAILRGRARADLTGQNGGYIELENSSSQILHRRRWRDGALIRGNGFGTVVCSDVVVLGPADDVPAGTPANTLIVRLTD